MVLQNENFRNVKFPACQNYGHKENISGDNFKGTVVVDGFNKRLKVSSYQGADMEGFVNALKNIAVKHELEKIIFNAKGVNKEILLKLGFSEEGSIPGFFAGEDCYCLSLFLTEERARSNYLDKEDKILQDITSSKKTIKDKPFPSGLVMKTAQKEDADKLVELYRSIFTTYPSPLLDVNYVQLVINDSVFFVAVFDGGKIVSAASAEVDIENKNAEITDCATLPDYRGQGLLTKVITELENEMWARGIHTLYSLARAGSYGMNAALHKLNYKFTGRMINNCHIAGRLEDMNIWVKLKSWI
ncbi:MAG: putative beta-lysine N-acetyltransferase [Desulfotomaculum sp.]|nr:putative beta-lysine N-acetyltransferase [Desulfotomaculum sp.]